MGISCSEYKNNNEKDFSIIAGTKKNNNIIQITTSYDSFNSDYYTNRDKNYLNLFEKGNQQQQILNKQKEENNKNIEEQYKREKKEEELKLELSKKDEENKKIKEELNIYKRNECIRKSEIEKLKKIVEEKDQEIKIKK